MRYTEYHLNKAVIRDKTLIPEAMAKLAKYENAEEWWDAKSEDVRHAVAELEGRVYEWSSHEDPDVAESMAYYLNVLWLAIMALREKLEEGAEK